MLAVRVIDQFAALSDVALSGLASGQFVVWNGTHYANHTLSSGDVTGALGYTPLSGNQVVTLSGDATGSGATAITVALKATGTAGTYGDASHVPVLTTDAQGRVTAVAPTAITPAAIGAQPLLADAAHIAYTDAASTFTAQQIFLTGTAGQTPVVIRQTGGTAGVNEGQIYHDGTNVNFLNPAGTGSTVSFTFGSASSQAWMHVNGSISVRSGDDFIGGNFHTTAFGSYYGVLGGARFVVQNGYIQLANGASDFGYLIAGPAYQLWGLSSTSTARQQAAFTSSFIVSTDAIFTSRVTVSATDHAGTREGLRIDTDGTQALLGVFGHTAAAQQTGDAATALAAYGWVTSPVYAPSHTGATAATRYMGGTASGPPGSGTFAAGDFAVDHGGPIWVCTVAGTPGTWAGVGGMAIGGALSGGTIGDLLCVGAGPVLAQISVITWNAAGGQLLINAASANNLLAVVNTGGASAQFAGPTSAAEFVDAAGHNVFICDGVNNILYTPGVSGNWASAAPTDVWVALDRLAAAVAGLLGTPVP